MKSHPARVLLLIGFALFIIMLFMLISCNTIPDKYQVEHGIVEHDTYTSGKYVPISFDTTYIDDGIYYALMELKYIDSAFFYQDSLFYYMELNDYHEKQIRKCVLLLNKYTDSAKKYYALKHQL